jgi:hypothetical protein
VRSGPSSSGGGVLEHPDDAHEVEALRVGEARERPADHLDGGQPGAAEGGLAGAVGLALEGHHPGAALTEEARQDTGAGADLEDAHPAAEQQRPQQVGAPGREVVARRPVRDRGGELVRAGGAVRGRVEDPEDPLLRPVGIADLPVEGPNGDRIVAAHGHSGARKRSGFMRM